ncbi:MAG: hypothetical protein ACRD3B_04435 [Candidatus Sulfotelmatobacter sp.]
MKAAGTFPSIVGAAEYVQAREAYSYDDVDVIFNISQTGALPHTGSFQGVFSRSVPATHAAGINLRKFEAICEAVFSDAAIAEASRSTTPAHYENVKSVTCAIVHWKMASQGGRGKVENVQGKWTESTCGQLVRAYQRCSLSEFCIGGVRLPTASAMLRFTHSNEYGIMDRRVVNLHTQPAGITTLNLRRDGYISDTKANVAKYYREYAAFLTAQAKLLAAAGVTFSDFDPAGNPVRVSFRPCDIEMALFAQ